MTFEDALRAAGLRPRDIVADGRWRRCPTDDKPRRRNGAYKLTPDGGLGLYRNWADLALGVCQWRPEGPVRVSQQDRARIERHRMEERRRRAAASASMREFWRSLQPQVGLHPYLAAKDLQVHGCSGLRQWRGQLVVPITDGERLLNVQIINAAGRKLFWKDCPVKAGAYVLDRPGAPLTAVCEGFATGLAVYQSVRRARVIVAFDAGNLLPVVQRMRPSGAVVMVADNDWGTAARRGFNPGVQAATNAAELIGAGVTWPQDIEGTDFADALREYGQGGARRIELQIQAAARIVMPSA